MNAMTTMSLARVVLVTLLVAGCAASPEPPAPAETRSDGLPADDGDAPPSLAASPAGSGESWVATDCSVARLAMPQDEESARTGLPPDARPTGSPTPDLVVLVADCAALVRGNTTVVKPFQWAMTYTSILPAEPGTYEGFAREMVLSDAEAATALTGFGFPAQAGTVATSGDGTTVAATVTAEGLEYSLTWAASPGSGTLASTVTYVMRGGDDLRSFWMRLDIARAGRATLSMPGAAQAEGGYLGATLPGGASAGFVDHATETWTVSFGEFHPGA